MLGFGLPCWGWGYGTHNTLIFGVRLQIWQSEKLFDPFYDPYCPPQMSRWRIAATGRKGFLIWGDQDHGRPDHVSCLPFMFPSVLLQPVNGLLFQTLAFGVGNERVAMLFSWNVPHGIDVSAEGLGGLDLEVDLERCGEISKLLAFNLAS